jgi:hypothetical protein
MTSFGVRLHVHESSRPIEGLVVTWFATSQQAVRKELRDPAAWDKVRHRRPSDLGLVRLGAAVSNANGVARLEYEMSGAERTRRVNSWFVVRTPDIADGKSCGRTIHVACELTPISSTNEESSVRIPQGVLDRSGVERRSSPTIDGSRSLADLEAVLRKAEDSSSPRKKSRSSYGSKVNARIVKRSRKADPDNGMVKMRVLPSVPNLELVSPKGAAVSIGYDAANKQLTVHDPATNRDVPIVFKGVRRDTSPGLTETQIKGPSVEVDESTGSAQISLPKVPDKLALEEAEPSDLFKFLTQEAPKRSKGNGARR